MNNNKNILGKRLRRLRDDKDLKQNKVASELSITPFQLSRYESGKSKPDPELIASFASYYNVTTDYLLGKSDNPHSTDGEVFDPLEEIRKITDELGIENLSFYDIEEWKNFTREDVEDIKKHFEYIAYRAKQRKKDN